MIPGRADVSSEKLESPRILLLGPCSDLGT